MMPPKGKSKRGTDGKTTTHKGQVTVAATSARSPSTEEKSSQHGDEETVPPGESLIMRRVSQLPTRVNLTAAQEQELAEFLQENPVLYDKGKEGWNDTGRKDAMWRQQADKMGIHLEVIKR